MKKNILLYFLFFIILLVISNLSKLDMDAIWSYGFSYNIANGMIPYRDFNMVIGPLYSLIFSIPIQLFGNYLIGFEVFHSLIFSFILVMMYKKIKNDIFYFLPFLCMIPFLSRYNVFCSFLMILILLLIDSENKFKDLVIGLLIGIIFMTKHNIGIPLFIVYFIYSKEHIKSIIWFFIPILICSLYLLCNDAFIEYINYCYLGMGSFLNNFYVEIIILISCMVIYYYLFKKYLKCKDLKLLYIFAFQVLIFPIIDYDHFIPAIIPISYYVFLTSSIKLKVLLRFMSIYLLIYLLIVQLISAEFMTENNFLKYKLLDKKLDNYLINYTDYINKIDGKLYVFIFNQYLLKIYNNEKIDFYDLINEGNFGLHKDELLTKLSDDCTNKKCYFILDKQYFLKKDVQMSGNFKEYVLNNATYVETLPSGDRLYVNKFKEED